MPSPIAQTFDSAKRLIIQHRLANRATTVQHGLRTDDASVGAELINFQVARGALPAPAAILPPKQSPQQVLPQPVAGAVEGLKRTAYGVAPLIDWLTSGGQAVPTELSTKRAEICSGCPKNEPPNLGKWFTVKASEAIQAALQKRNDLQLSTPFDDKLGVCSACLCPMKLKVHTPLDIILEHLKPQISADLDPRCWILSQDK